MLKKCVSDIETNGLLDKLDHMYCAVITDYDTGKPTLYTNIEEYLDALNKYDKIYFHNGIKFDIPALEQVSMRDLSHLRPKIRDTLVLSRLLFATLASIDKGKRFKYKEKYPLPSRLTGSHSLGAWGYRLGDYKGDFDPSDYKDADGYPCTWENVGLNEDMLKYCEQDGAVTLKLVKVLEKKLSQLPDGGRTSADLEHSIAWLMAKQERNGFYFRVRQAEDFYATLSAKRKELTDKLVDTFGSWYAGNGTTAPKRTIQYRKDVLRGDLTEGATYTKVKHTTFKPSSRAHAAKCMKELFGWEPREFTPSGEPKIDGDVLAALDYPEAKLLKEYFDLLKVIGMLGDGKNAWLKLEKDGFIYGEVNPNGAGTGRATHSRPNLAQIPKGKEGSLGHMCRSLFSVPDTWVLLGTDASGLELRCLGNALAPYDGGRYAEIVVNGDIHWENVLALGLIPKGTKRDKKNNDHEAARDKAKTWIYAFLYGAGDELLGEAVGFTEEERIAWRAAGKHKAIIKRLKDRGEPVTVKRVGNILKGGELRKAFIKAIPAIKAFQEDCKNQHKDNSFVRGLDGREIHTRSGHSATNFQLQGDGAAVCKLWGVVMEQMLLDKGLKHGWDGDFAFQVWVHDEYQIACRNEKIAHIVGQTAKEAMTVVAETFGFVCPLDADYDIGSTWAETH